jgi:hypothetical protein
MVSSFDNDEDAIFEGLRSLIGDPERLLKLKNHQYPEDILNDDLKLQKIYDFIDSTAGQGINDEQSRTRFHRPL